MKRQRKIVSEKVVDGNNIGTKWKVLERFVYIIDGSIKVTDWEIITENILIESQALKLCQVASSVEVGGTTVVKRSLF